MSRQALDQQTSDNTVSAKRGNIYDRNYKVLATNTTVETISITPETLRTSISKKNMTIDEVAQRFADILELEKDAVKDKISKKIQNETLKKKVDKTVADTLREYVNASGLSGVAFTEDVKRYYPYNILQRRLLVSAVRTIRALKVLRVFTMKNSAVCREG